MTVTAMGDTNMVSDDPLEGLIAESLRQLVDMPMRLVPASRFRELADLVEGGDDDGKADLQG